MNCGRGAMLRPERTELPTRALIRDAGIDIGDEAASKEVCGRKHLFRDGRPLNNDRRREIATHEIRLDMQGLHFSSFERCRIAEPYSVSAVRVAVPSGEVTEPRSHARGILQHNLRIRYVQGRFGHGVLSWRLRGCACIPVAFNSSPVCLLSQSVHPIRSKTFPSSSVSFSCPDSLLRQPST